MNILKEFEEIALNAKIVTDLDNVFQGYTYDFKHDLQPYFCFKITHTITDFTLNDKLCQTKKEAVKEPKKKAETKNYTVIKAITIEKLYNVGDIVSVEIGSDLENYLLTNKHINKYGISRPN